MSKFKPFSEKQLTALTWWCESSPHKNRDAIICDGAVRSGKTLCMSISFVSWAFSAFGDYSFAFCGKTITSLRRNVITPLLSILATLGFCCEHKISKNYITVSLGGRRNRFYLFGGKDEASASFIQGVTLAGVMFDEVALMPRSFVEQALARCSVAGSKFWFNCNPEHPFHWFYLEWIKKAEAKNAFYLHFTMKDNPSLSSAILERYSSLYSGAFYERFVLGKWCSVSGTVYSMFSRDKHIVESLPERFEKYCISCDYGTVNPASFGLWGLAEGVWYRIREYYYNSRITGEHKTDREYLDAVIELAGKREISVIVVDPSAAGFIETLRRHGSFTVTPAKNDVTDGIGKVCEALRSGAIKIHSSCLDTIREFSLYSWDMNSKSDAPVKANDHAMDDIRYFVATIMNKEKDSFFVLSVHRKEVID
ncbi:MAG: PBSX family phage terminase large subunit [Oscillospiraceae bacterium]|nr:PBSX family phage terminase large subunit [Oscillospiraceae bacterium]